MESMHWWIRNIIAPIALCLILFYTNPSRDSLPNYGRVRNVGNFSWIAKLFDSNLRNILANEKYYNIGIVSIIHHNSSSYSIGLAGFWIKSSFLSTIPGWFLLFQMVWAVVESARRMIYLWVEIIISIIWCVHMAQLLESTFHVEKFESTFYLVTSLLIYVVTNAVFFPSGMFKPSKLHPGSMLYGVGSALLIYLTAMQDHAGFGRTFRWHTFDVSFSQLSLLVVVMQLLLGSPMGLAGSMAGILMYMLVESRVLDESRW